MASVDEIRTVRAAIKDNVSLRGDVRAITAEGVLTRMVRDALDAELQEEIRAFGDDVYEAAKAGWNALRGRNPNVDKSTGTAGGEITSFDELPAKVKLNYLTFTQGALSGSFPQRVVLGSDASAPSVIASGGVFTGPLGTPIPTSFDEPLVGFEEIGTVSRDEPAELGVFKPGDKVRVAGPLTWGRGIHNDYLEAGEPEPCKFSVGDRVRVTGPLRTVCGGWVSEMIAGEEAVVTRIDDVSGDVQVDAGDYLVQDIDPASLTLVTEPRTWDQLRDIPEDVSEVKDCHGDPVKRNATSGVWDCGCAGGRSFDHTADDWFGPYTEVMND